MYVKIFKRVSLVLQIVATLIVCYAVLQSHNTLLSQHAKRQEIVNDINSVTADLKFVQKMTLIAAFLFIIAFVMDISIEMRV